MAARGGSLGYNGEVQSKTDMADNEKKDQKKELYKSEYLGSGTFQITKPKRNPAKQHEARTHSPQKRARRRN